jgi:hypothetical protein
LVESRRLMNFIDTLASQKFAWRFLAAEAVATVIFVGLVMLCVNGNDRSWWTLALWLTPVTAGGSLLCLLASLVPTPIHWGRTFLAALLLVFWCFVGRLDYLFSHGAMLAPLGGW